MANQNKKQVIKRNNTYADASTDTATTICRVALWFLVALLIISPFLRGLFFSADQLNMLLFALIPAILTVVYIWYCRRQTLKNNGFLNHPLDYFMLALPGAYLVACFTAVNPGLAVNELVENSLYFIVFWCAARLLTTTKQVHQILMIIYLVAVALALTGLATASGIIYIDDGYVGGRIYSALQYPNALATYLGMALFIGLYFIANRPLSLLLIAGNYLLLLVFLGTGSRGGLLILLLVLPLFILLNRSASRKSLLLTMLVTTLTAVPAITMFIRSVESGNPLIAWLYLLLGLVLVTIIFLVGQRLLKYAHRQHIYGGLLALTAIVAAGVLILFSRGGLANMTGQFHLLNTNLRNMIERFEFMATALVMLQERPLTGWGGGGWQAAYRAFQEYHVNAKQVHSYFLQLGVETGILGLLVVLGIGVALALTLYSLFKQGQRDLALLLAAIIMFVAGRAAIDFDLSLAALTIALVTCLGIARGLINPRQPVTPVVSNKNNGQLLAALLLITIALTAAGSLAYSNIALERSYAQLQQNNIKAALHQATIAAQTNPFDPEINLYLFSLYQLAGDRRAAEQQLLKTIAKDPYNAGARSQMAMFLYQQKKYQPALAAAKKAIALAPMQMVWYENLAELAVLIATDKIKQNQPALAQKYSAIVLELPLEMSARHAALSAKHQRLWVDGPRLNTITPEMRLRLDQAQALYWQAAALDASG